MAKAHEQNQDSIRMYAQMRIVNGSEKSQRKPVI